ncbi:Mu-type opioid receptor [Dirofilaria immitis]
MRLWSMGRAIGICTMVFAKNKHSHANVNCLIVQLRLTDRAIEFVGFTQLNIEKIKIASGWAESKNNHREWWIR